MNNYRVTYRSADGDLNSEIIAAKDEQDARNVFDGSYIIKVASCNCFEFAGDNSACPVHKSLDKRA